ncbi:MAG TPA: class I SAM-dependent methyltransferase [Pyrinomonadaceae bacterium]|nr:class I SAM-dependent methyltransferase [Pyrinomonadaceae bacterium]
MPERWKSFDLVEAFQLSQAVRMLHQLELFEALKKPATARELASKYELDANMLRGVLEYVAARTDLLRRTGEAFVATRQSIGASRFLFELYVGAYGDNARRLADSLRDPSVAPGAVDLLSYARAFDAVDGSNLGILPALIRQLEFNHVLDLGCGNGALLLELARQDAHFIGWGIDLNPAMCRVARARICAAGAGKRVRVIRGDCRKLNSVLPIKVSAAVRAVTACNVANEMFSDGHRRAVSWLRGLRKALPGRPLLIDDYYGRLGGKKGRTHRETLLHDYAQLISGQGVPPACAKEWRTIYARAGCRLAHIIEDKTTTRFIHLLQL